ncbi:unnamed protein product [Toxocara canis]|uniref:RBR-type E3 ubiquitin transferase n=1 Tax=Toxocara canis TaxID=6265 RepID=A0A183UNY2_TOXCA|nr:unnamed protein product [Toxocara canis]
MRAVQLSSELIQELEPEEVAAEMNVAIEDVAGIMHLPSTVCRLLLHHYNWNKESLLEKFYDSSDSNAFFAEANIVSPLNLGSSAVASKEPVGPCVICCCSSRLTILRASLLLRLLGYESRPVNCKCGTVFCFSCGYEWHEPVNCRLLRLWLKKCKDDSETSNWISANTKECPRCHATIEKDGGCNHVICKNAACKMEFCWVCLGPWEPHGNSWYSCNRFDDSLAKKARDVQERSRAALQRYLHYYNRFMNHQHSLKLENKLYTTVKKKMEVMQQANMSWIEVQFLQKAVDVLSLCRRTLMYTYAFAFYLQKDNQSMIFEDNQRDLEHATEQLSEFLERDLDKENLISLKQKVQDKYRYVEQRRDALLRHCAEGVERDFWKFTD